MKISTFTAVWLLASLFLSWPSFTKGASTTGKPGEASAADHRLDLVTAIQAVSPNPSLGDQANLFGRFIGTWDVEYTDFSEDGTRTLRFGEFIVGWVMDGRVIQDLWIVYPSEKRKDREVYTDLRYYDPKSGTWSSTFIDPEHTSVARFTGVAVGDVRIVLGTRDFGGRDTRWSVNDIHADSFVWREEESLDGGKTWRLLAEHHMKRRRAVSSANR